MMTDQLFQERVELPPADHAARGSPNGARADADSSALRYVPLAALVEQCRTEADDFRRGGMSSDVYSYELFRRAICERDARAWDAVFAQYRMLVLAWIRRHPARASLGDDDEYWVNRTFERFWRAIGPERFSSFPGAVALLRYLKLCAHSVVLDEVRAQHGPECEPISEYVRGTTATDAEYVTLGRMTGEELWAEINASAKDETERLVAYLCLVLEMKPREAYARYPEQFGSVAEVYAAKRNLLDRLRRNPTFRRLESAG